jgi:hypothetical protein
MSTKRPAVTGIVGALLLLLLVAAVASLAAAAQLPLTSTGIGSYGSNCVLAAPTPPPDQSPYTVPCF